MSEGGLGPGIGIPGIGTIHALGGLFEGLARRNQPSASDKGLRAAQRWVSEYDAAHRGPSGPQHILPQLTPEQKLYIVQRPVRAMEWAYPGLGTVEALLRFAPDVLAAIYEQGPNNPDYGRLSGLDPHWGRYADWGWKWYDPSLSGSAARGEAKLQRPQTVRPTVPTYGGPTYGNIPGTPGPPPTSAPATDPRLQRAQTARDYLLLLRQILCSYGLLPDVLCPEYPRASSSSWTINLPPYPYGTPGGTTGGRQPMPLLGGEIGLGGLGQLLGVGSAIARQWTQPQPAPPSPQIQLPGFDFPGVDFGGASPSQQAASGNCIMPRQATGLRWPKYKKILITDRNGDPDVLTYVKAPRRSEGYKVVKYTRSRCRGRR